MGINLAQQETITSNTAVALGDVVTQINSNLQSANLADIRDRPQSTTGFVFETTYGRSAFQPIVNARAKDNTVVQELREWRANLFTNYTFDEDSILNGFSVGGALRWQDNVATGYQLKMADGALVSDTSRPFFGPDELAGDVWVTHRRKLRDNVDWKVQLNIRNLIGEDSFIPVGNNPDGSLAVVRNPNPTEVFLTNTFSF
jgi:outer membrane receptor for ferric coprogen and ferric-rhodotorulic acid